MSITSLKNAINTFLANISISLPPKQQKTIWCFQKEIVSGMKCVKKAFKTFFEALGIAEKTICISFFAAVGL